MAKQLYNFLLSLATICLWLTGIMIICGVIVGFDYIYQDQMALACAVVSNITMFFLAKSYEIIKRKDYYMLCAGIILAIFAVLEFLYFADRSKLLVTYLAMLANVLYITRNQYEKILIWAILRKSKLEMDLEQDSIDLNS